MKDVRGLGMIALERPKGLLTAIDYFRDALIQERNYVDARFQMAKARLLLMLALQTTSKPAEIQKLFDR